MRWPGHARPGSVCGRLVSTIDIAPTVLKLAAIEPGPSFQGKDFSPLLQDPAAKIHDLIFAERNWHDYAARGRAVRSERFKYIKNDDHARPLTPPADAVRSPTFVAMRRLSDAGKLTAEQRGCFEHPRPAEELYDLDTDPHELVNLAAVPKFAKVLDEMRRACQSGNAKQQISCPASSRRMSSTGRPASRFLTGHATGGRCQCRNRGSVCDKLEEVSRRTGSDEEESPPMTKKSIKPSSRKKRAKGSKSSRSTAPVERSSDFVMMRFGRIEEMNRSFDIEYWQRQGDAAIYREAWELVEAYWRDRGLNPDELRLQRSIATFQRQ